ncbi:MAG: GvpL/GvpF family gas vesicle protein [Alphaproteobacteria bacterium]
MPGISTLHHSPAVSDRPAFFPAATGKRPVFLSRDLYGFVPAGFSGEPAPGVLKRYQCIRAGSVAALAGPPSLRLPVRNRVRHALGKLRTYQRVLEEVMRRTPVLPARFGSRLPDRSTALRLLSRNEDRLTRAIATYGHLLQLELRVSGPRVEPGVGSRILAAREHIRLELKNLCLAMQERTDASAGTLLGLTMLIRPFDEARLDAALARLDGEFGGWLRFHCIGPLPPCNFIRAAVERSGNGASGWTLNLNSTLPGAAWPPILNPDFAQVRGAA